MPSRPILYSSLETWFLDVAAERVVAGARLFLVLFALIAVTSDAELHGPRVREAYAALGIYFVWALAIRLVLLQRPLGRTLQRITHIYDIAIVSILMFLTDSPASSSYFVFYSFILIAATLLFGWIEVIATAATLASLFAVMILSELLLFNDPDPMTVAETNRIVIRSAYLFVVGGMLGYIRAYWDYGQQRLAALAIWPTSTPNVEQKFPALDRAIRHAAQVMRVPRVLVLWSYTDELSQQLSYYGPAGFIQDRKSSDHFKGLVVAEIAGRPFASNDVVNGPVFTGAGQIVSPRTGQQSFASLSPDFIAAYDVKSAAGAPFATSTFSGWIFAFDRAVWRDDDLSLLQIVAANIENEIEHHLVANQRAVAAALRERVTLARELHDSILQGLTAARLRLQSLFERVDGSVQAGLQEVRDLLTSEQRRIREFVDAVPEMLTGEYVELRTDLHYQTEELEGQWSCRIDLTVDPMDLSVTTQLSRELKFIVSEAVSNAVNHGKASNVAVHVSGAANALNVRIQDDGCGFTVASQGRVGLGPKSLRRRVESLGGKLLIENSSHGVLLLIELPLQ